MYDCPASRISNGSLHCIGLGVSALKAHFRKYVGIFVHGSAIICSTLLFYATALFSINEGVL